MLKKILAGLSLLMSQACWATDTYNPVTNQLSIPRVEVMGTTYIDVVISVGSVSRIDGGPPIVRLINMILQRTSSQFLQYWLTG